MCKMCRLWRIASAVILGIMLAYPLSAGESNSPTEAANITQYERLHVRSKEKSFEETTDKTDAKIIELSDEPDVAMYDNGDFFATVTTEKKTKLARNVVKRETISTTEKPKKPTKKPRKKPTKWTRKITTTKARKSKPSPKATKTKKTPKTTKPPTTTAPTGASKRGIRDKKNFGEELAEKAAGIVSKAVPTKPDTNPAENGKTEKLTMLEDPKRLEKPVEEEVMQIKVEIKAMAKDLAELKADLHRAIKPMNVTGLTVVHHPGHAVTVQLESAHGKPERPRLFNAAPPRPIPGMEIRNCSMSPEDRIAIVNKHNEFRLQVAQGRLPNQPKGINLRRMEWDDDLERASEYVARTGNFAHITLSDTRFHYGQNLHKHDSTDYSDPNWMRGLESWFSEHNGYVYGPVLDHDPKGHYTQLVWAYSMYIGCSMCHIHNHLDPTFHEMNYYVCHYGPSGNYRGELPYKLGPSGCENLC